MKLSGYQKSQLNPLITEITKILNPIEPYQNYTDNLIFDKLEILLIFQMTWKQIESWQKIVVVWTLQFLPLSLSNKELFSQF